ncbi:FAD-dependent oxidoreductase [Streptomyces sp. CBMA123]|uniref:FAD-dependent oxidoreductase n=1 Tax=Streptomyces sp. CBMA123 TaxID=1896313 RepID=UPI001661A86F|nr:NAD(P)-binding protein [Streptomyces sp. CBMA123]MBD0693572.1 monooxygenase [Streptomyces sp. CBMA123]
MARTSNWDSAVVIGGGYAGLLAARVLSGHFGRVTVLEQDTSPGPDARPGVPQAHHPHALLARGAARLEELFPGLRAELHAQGRPVIDFGAGTKILFPTGWTPRNPVGIEVQLLPRTALEHAIRERVTALDNVAFQNGLRVERLLLDADRDAVTVAARTRAPGHPSAEEQLFHADLVVDATGRGSRLPQWLAEAGFARPATLTVDGQAAYASRLYTLEPDPARDWSASYQPTIAPTSPRGGVAVRIAPDQWLLGLIGAAGHTPPADEDGFRAFAGGLSNPDFARIIDQGTPAGPVHRTRTTANRWHRYDRVPHWPGRLIALGDSVCAFNPVYGQGMTVAALQSALLDTLLSQHTLRVDLDRLGPTFQRGAAALVRNPWLLNISTDQGWQDTGMPLTSRIATGFLGALTARLPHHPGLYLRFVRTMQMLDSPASLSSPRALAQLASIPSTRRHLARSTCPGATG